MKSATVYKKKDGLYLHSYSPTTVGVRISTPPFIRIRLDDTAESKSAAVRSVLEAAMARTVPHPAQEEWDGVFAPMLSLAGVKTLTEFERDARCCGLESDEGQLRIIPHQKLGRKRNYEGLTAETVTLPIASSPDEIAEALEEGFRRCYP